ncbi:hypothetical protein BS47DRAFT_751989 [Hydnum rufescens UP504]|uniref:Uncharacterized protein n=1 Tax=Hydnum rufescens UP504 TaxID=1448309 RepID=A0A9P6B9Y5_9AGAM|nr:hypothetical protein BS47DRAFT_751989 [Hydnum rufescens UP504]
MPHRPQSDEPHHSIDVENFSTERNDSSEHTPLSPHPDQFPPAYPPTLIQGGAPTPGSHSRGPPNQNMHLRASTN